MSSFLLQNVVNKSQADIERFVWSNKKAWMPRPLLSLHVRMGDKAVEMKVVGFEEYMRLADRMRKRFPELNSIWLSTEMQVWGFLTLLSFFFVQVYKVTLLILCVMLCYACRKS